MPDLRQVLDSATFDAEGMAIDAPEGWTQGRTLYGGMTAALAAYATARTTNDLPPLRSAQFSFVGPAAGALRVVPTLLRRGRSSAVVGVDCLSEGVLAMRGVLTYGAARESTIRHAPPRRQALRSPAECEAFMPNRDGRPGFFNNFELKLAAGVRPFSGGEPPAFEIWVRFIEKAEVDPTIALLALADSPPPAAMVSFSTPAPISTMTWSIDILSPVTAGEWRYLTSVSEAAAEGYSQQAMDVFSEDGVRIAVGRQTVAIFT